MRGLVVVLQALSAYGYRKEAPAFRGTGVDLPALATLEQALEAAAVDGALLSPQHGADIEAHLTTELAARQVKLALNGGIMSLKLLARSLR